VPSSGEIWAARCSGILSPFRSLFCSVDHFSKLAGVFGAATDFVFPNGSGGLGWFCFFLPGGQSSLLAVGAGESALQAALTLPCTSAGKT